MTEEQVFEKFKKGEIDDLYRRMYARLLLFATARLGDEVSFMAEDCVQEAIYKTYLHRNELSTPAVFKSYLYSCINNQAITYLRKHEARENYMSQAETEVEFLSSYIEQETLGLLYEAIGRLPEKYKELFRLSFEKGLKNAEVAKRLQVSDSTVKKQKSQMLEWLRKEVSMYDELGLAHTLVILYLLSR